MTFTLLTPLPTELAVGETAVIGVHVESSEPFRMAIALSDAYYPGRSVRFDGSAATRTTEADLFLTITGTQSTATSPPCRTGGGRAGAEASPHSQSGWAFGSPVGYIASTSFLFAVAVA